MYEVLLERSTKKNLKSLPPKTFHKIFQQIKSLAENPRPRGCKKLSGKQIYWRLRSGKFRILYQIDDSNKKVHILGIRHRREAYR